MRRALGLAVPALVAAALLLFAGPAYARFLASATAISRDAVPPAKAPVAVRTHGSVLAVHTGAGVVRVDAGAIAWNLPVLLCLWGWVVRRRWLGLAGLALLLVALHVAVADVEIRKAMGEAQGWPYALTRAWFGFGAVLLPVFAVALAWALGESPRPKSPRPKSPGPESPRPESPGPSSRTVDRPAAAE